MLCALLHCTLIPFLDTKSYVNLAKFKALKYYLDSEKWYPGSVRGYYFKEMEQSED